MNSVFSEQILADKLSKLNSTQQCIETLSHWCIFHRSKAELVVATWEKQFHRSQMTEKVPLLYLANDILQNSKRKGNEFVSEFWKVLPEALKDVLEKADDHGKNVVSRLVDIWEQRRVFGSRAQSLKAIIFGEEVPAPLEFGKKRSRSVRIVKRDSRSIRTKLSIGSAAEKIVSAFHLVLSEHPSEDTEMNKCKTAVQRVRKIEKDVDIACPNAKDPKRKSWAKELEEEESLLKQCIEKLKSVEATRVALVSQLKEALHNQESELENVRTQMQVAQAQAEEASNIRKRLDDEDYVWKPSSLTTPPIDSKKSAAAIAAEVADRLAASSSSQMIMTSVLSTFALEEAKNTGLTKTSTPSTTFTSTSVSASTENSLPVSDHNGFISVRPITAHQNYQSVLAPQQYQQYMQQPSGVLNPYGYGSIPHLPPVPPPPHMVSPMVVPPLTQQMMQMTQPMALTQQPPAPPSFRPLQPPGMVYYGQPHHSQ